MSLGKGPLIPPSIKSCLLQGPSISQICHWSIADATNWWQDQNPPFIPPVWISSEATSAAIRAPLLVASPLCSPCHIFKRSAWVGHTQLFILVKQQQWTLLVHSSSSSRCGSSTSTEENTKLQPLTSDGSRYGSETLPKSDQSSHFLTFQQGEGCLPSDPEICHHSSPAMPVQTLIDSPEQHWLFHSGDILQHGCSSCCSAMGTWCFSLLPLMLFLLFQSPCSRLALLEGFTTLLSLWGTRARGPVHFCQSRGFDPDSHVLLTDQCSARLCVTGLDYFVYENLVFGD